LFRQALYRANPVLRSDWNSSPENKTSCLRLGLLAPLHHKCNGRREQTRTAAIPTIRVPHELRHAAKELLIGGETLSGFVEDAVQREGDYH
jgi:hypothetical protein